MRRGKEILSSVLMASLVLAGCGNKTERVPRPYLPDASSAHVGQALPIEQLTGIVQAWYPEAAGMMPVYSSTVFRTTHHIYFAINFDPSIKFNDQSGAKLFTYYESFAPAEGIQTELRSPTGNQLPVIVYPRDSKAGKDASESKLLLLLPKEAPRPSKWAFTGDNYPTAATVTYGYESVATYIVNRGNSDSPFAKDAVGYTNFTLPVEACQQAIVVGSYTNQGEAVDGQEVICNSLGVAYYLKQKNTKFDDYFKAINSISTSFGYMGVPLSKESYDNIPTIEPVVTSK